MTFVSSARDRCVPLGVANGCVLLAVAIALMWSVGPAAAVVVNLNPVKDNMLVEDAAGATSNGAGADFVAGRTNEGSTGRIRRALVQFDLSAIPTTATVTAVTFTMTRDRGKGGGTQNVTVHRVQASWGEGTSNSDAEPGKGAPASTNDATWLHRFYSGTTWAAAGGDYAAAASATTAVGPNGTYNWTSAPLVADVQQWVSNPATNFGWLVRGNESAKATARRFRSRTSAAPPVLQVTYVVGVATGGCCTGTDCTELTAADCALAGGVYRGDGTTCTPNPCVAPTGACCQNNGACSELTAAQCASAAGTYQGDGTSCTPNPCPVVLTPFIDPLPIPAPATPTSGTVGGTASYALSMREVSQQLHSELPTTRVWGFGDGASGASYPGPTIEASTDNPVTVTWVNDLRDINAALRLTHYLPVDTCMHGPDTRGVGPRTVVHLHGGHVPPEADGYPDSTFLPGDQRVYVYPNNQQAGTPWYHDHALGITRLNVMMGLAGFWIIRDPVESALVLPTGEYDVPVVIQDRMFNPDGSLKYLDSWQEHFFGDKILVNGKVWPYLDVKAGKYRFRLLNGSNSRSYKLTLSNGAPFWVIGNDLGLLPVPVHRDTLTLTPGERYDVVIDFQPYSNGTQITLLNSAPAPFPGSPGVGVIPNVMRFNVVAGSAFTSPLPATLRPVPPIPENEAVETRTLELRKIGDDCTSQMWSINGLHWDDVTEFPKLGTTEIWSFVNRSGVTHPMHMHLVQFQILDRQPFTIVADTVQTTGPRVPPDSSEAGWKDTAPVGPFEILRVIARFEDYLGRYAYHCHILEHEDHEMMRQFQVIDPSAVLGHGPLHGVELAKAFPNPTTGPVRIGFTLPGRAQVRLIVEDVAGRRVATLLDGLAEAGGHQVIWDARGPGGATVAPGVYFYHLIVNDRPASARRVVVVQ